MAKIDNKANVNIPCNCLSIGSSTDHLLSTIKLIGMKKLSRAKKVISRFGRPSTRATWDEVFIHKLLGEDGISTYLVQGLMHVKSVKFAERSFERTSYNITQKLDFHRYSRKKSWFCFNYYFLIWRLLESMTARLWNDHRNHFFILLCYRRNNVNYSIVYWNTILLTTILSFYSTVFS